ncbi:5-oxoprolinase subunit B family protein [Geodermatophilus sp. URMC 62]|uniref:5-oxoprolinase subunit B family protein n=1 Tax=Geodermatophilus sp. URMC 62 TaxID=3423414 RepID=UPI00406D02C9
MSATDASDATTASRYSWGGDEHLVVQVSEEMSLEANSTVVAVTDLLRQRRLDGVIDICPANASFLIRFDPDVLAPADLEAAVRGAEAEVADAPSLTLETRVVEVPVWYADPWTTETGGRFRDRHQRPQGTDLEFAAAENGLSSVQEFIDRHSGAPWITSMVGFVAGLPFLFQMVSRDRQLQVPKYLRPRTDTPPLTVGHGGCFACIYSVRGAGGYQMFGVTPAPIFDPAQTLPDFADFMVFFRPGDIVKFRPVDEDEYHRIREEVSAGRFRFRQQPFRFSLDEFHADPDAYNRTVLEVLDGD